MRVSFGYEIPSWWCPLAQQQGPWGVEGRPGWPLSSHFGSSVGAAGLAPVTPLMWGPVLEAPHWTRGSL